MTIDSLIMHVRERVTEAENWEREGLIGEIVGLKIRDYHCVAKPMRIHSDSTRKEYFGIVFRVIWEGPSGRSFADLDVRLNPEGSMKKQGPGRAHLPYYAVYLADLSEMKALITWKEFAEDLPTEVTLVEFFRTILDSACRDPHCKKIFGVKQAFAE